MPLPTIEGMSFPADWTGLVIRDTKRNVCENTEAALIYTEVRRRHVTHVCVGERLGYSFFIDAPPLAVDTDEAYRRIAA